MKRISIYFFLAILVWSCSKEDGNSFLNPNTAIESRQSTDNNVLEFDIEQYKNCFDEIRVSLGKECYEEYFGTSSIFKFLIENDSTKSLVIPNVKEEKINSLLWVKSDKSIVVIEKTDYITELDETVLGVSKNIPVLFGFNGNKLLNGYISLEEMNLILGGAYDISSDNSNTITLVENNFNIAVPSNALYAKPYLRDCVAQDLIEFYYYYFGLFGEFGPDYSVIPLDIMTQAILSTQPSNGYCVCPTQCYLLKMLIPLL